MDTDSHLSSHDALAAAAGQLRARLADAIAPLDERHAELSALIREAEAWDHRRAASNARDRACYRLGAALEPAGGLALDDVALTGLDHLGTYGVLLLAHTALNSEARSLSDLLRQLFHSSAGPALWAWGVWARWQWLRSLYVAETETFLASKTGSNPKVPWRRAKVTQRQRYLCGEIGRLLALDIPDFANRGTAFEWIRDHGGNPRFTTPPPLPALPDLAPADADDGPAESGGVTGRLRRWFGKEG